MNLEDLARSYRQYVQASIQIRECASFGGGLVELFQKQIADHQAAERAYIDGELARRAAEVADLKAISHK